MQAQRLLQPDSPTYSQTNNANEAFSHYMENLQQELEENWRGGYTQMPDEIRQDATLSPRAKIIYEQLLSYMWFKSDHCWPSQQTLAEATGYSRRTVIRALQDLYNRGYIEKWRRGLGETNYYFINPLSFVRSFCLPGQDKSIVPLRENIQDQKDTLSFTLPDSSCQISHTDTSRSDNMTHSNVPECHTKYTKQKKIQLASIDSSISSPSPEKSTFLATSTWSPPENCIKRNTIEIHKASFSSATGGNDANGLPELPFDNAKVPCPRSQTKKRNGAMQDAPLLTSIIADIPDDYLIKLGMAPIRKRRPTPEFIVRIITDYTYEMGDNPKCVKSNITRATKMYYTACAIFSDIQDNPEEHFTQMLFLAKEDVRHISNIRYRTSSHINRMPAFFACLENRFGFKPEERAYLYSNEPLYVN